MIFVVIRLEIHAMLFSAGVDLYRCNDCDDEFENAVPTSIIPMAITCVLAGSQWAVILDRVFGKFWAFNILGFVTAFVTLWLIYECVERLANNALRTGHCPKCGSKLERIGGGFADGCIPNPRELLVYALTIVLGFGTQWLFSLFEPIGG